MPRQRLAVVTSHPIQYYAPWFVELASRPSIELKVFYLWDFGVRQTLDPEFGRAIAWDIPLLQGYANEFVPNTAKDPGTHHFFGLQNPELVARLAQFAPDAVLLLSYSFWSTLTLIWSQSKRWPMLFRGDSHRLQPRRGLKAWIKHQLVRLTFSKLHACLYVGTANRGYFVDHGVAADRLFFAPHAIDQSRFADARSQHATAAAALRAQLGLGENHRLALFVGKFEWQKDPLTLLRAFAKIDNPRFHLLIVGDGPMRNEMAQIATQRVHFLPFQNQTAIPSIYAAADVVVLPSVSETWGMVINEAQAAGTPVIVSDQVGCQADLVENGVSGLVFRAGDAATLAAMLNTILSDDELAHRLARCGRELAQRYSYAAASDGLLRALKR
jgi:glycosyltransferase involved in cell wall biosynthesis